MTGLVSLRPAAGPAIALVTWVFVLLGLLVAMPASAQTRRVDGGSASFGTFSFYWETRLSPATPPLSDSFGGAYATTVNEVHRILLDGNRRVYFGYTVRIEAAAERTQYSLTFRPLTLTPALMTRFDIDATWKPLPAPQFPGAQVVRSGEVLELSLLSNNASAQRLTEYVTVQEPVRTRGFTGPEDRDSRELVVAPGTARDFTVDDAVLHLREARISVNGRLEESSQRLLGDETGTVVWIYVPGRGRFLLSIVRNSGLGFRRAGDIRGSSLRFTIGADTYSVNTAGRIAPGDAAFNLYVLHQPKWRPGYPHADLEAATVGAADRVEDLLTR